MTGDVPTLLARLVEIERRLARLEETVVPRAELDRLVAEHQKDILALIMLISAKTRGSSERRDSWHSRGVRTLQ
ncbi:MAG TPA: SlyX family protein [Firmicutes bacterium]|jgi:hypothetical protein|nr:SlyX family protein [Bacillota bacterium]